MTKTILILAANPKDTQPLRFDQEVREIENGLQRSKRRDEFYSVHKLAVRQKDLRRAMLDHKPNIVHFCGHGEGEAGIVIEDEIGYARFMDTETLAEFFGLFSASVECIVLNACFSKIQADAIAKHIPCVVGIGDTIRDTHAIEFATAFYDALGAGESFEFAFKLASNAIRADTLPESFRPVFVTQSTNSQASISAHERHGQWMNPLNSQPINELHVDGFWPRKSTYATIRQKYGTQESSKRDSQGRYWFCYPSRGISFRAENVLPTEEELIDSIRVESQYSSTVVFGLNFDMDKQSAIDACHNVGALLTENPATQDEVSFVASIAEEDCYLTLTFRHRILESLTIE